MTTPRFRDVPAAVIGRPASASTTTLIVAAVVLLGAVITAVVIGGRGPGQPPKAAPAAAPAPATAAPEAPPDPATGIATCDEMIKLIRCAQPRLPAEQQDGILESGRKIVRAIDDVKRLGQQAPELTARLEAACREGTGQLRTALAGLPSLAPCLAPATR